MPCRWLFAVMGAFCVVWVSVVTHRQMCVFGANAIFRRGAHCASGNGSAIIIAVNYGRVANADENHRETRVYRERTSYVTIFG
jgi:hypothetical protein